MKYLLPIREHFFWRTVQISIGATLIASIGIIAVSFILIRHHMLEDFHQETLNVVSAYRFSTAYKDLLPFKKYLQELGLHTQFKQLCTYDAENNLVTKWSMLDTGNHCPKLMVESGINAGMFSVSFAEPVELNGQYLGMIYSEGNFLTLKSWIINGAALLTGLLIICWVTCRMATSRSARDITAQLAAIRGQIECLKENDAIACALPPHAMLEEIAQLSETILSLRVYLDNAKVPKEAVINLKRWYWEILAEMLASLRHLLDADSPLLIHLNDYALLVQAERSDIVPPTESFNIAHVLDKALTTARKASSISSQINLTASLQSNMPREWLGQPEILETLLRHMLLIGLKRTHSGLVCLRLHITAESRLHIAFEDSGPSIQRWQITQWLAPAKDETLFIGMTSDISWLLVSALFKQLGGNVTGTSNAEGGLILEGSLPLEHQNSQETSLIQIPLQPVPNYTEESKQPLALVVESKHIREQKITSLLAKAGCLSLTVATHAEALMWANVMPFSVIILNTTISDAKEDTLRRLLHMQDEGTLPVIPIWAITTRLSFVVTNWQNQGIKKLLLMPISVETLKVICLELSSPDFHFYQSHDLELRQDFNTKILESLPEIENMLASHVADIVILVEALAAGNKSADIISQVHAVKSAALTLGYFRLAALMGQIEHTIYSRHFSSQNWNIIAQCLKEYLANETIRIQSNATLYHHNAPAHHDVAPAD